MRLSDWRKSKGLKQEDISDQIDVTVSQYSKIERGETFTSPAVAEKIQALTNGEVTATDLLAAWSAYRADVA